MPLKVLISGAGVSGPALSTLLLRANPAHNITVVERSPALRKGGQQIDLRGQGIPVMQKLGLMDAVRARAVAEDGIALMDPRHSRECAVFGRNDSGQGRQALTSEYEIMRGDLVDVLYGASLEAARSGPPKGGLKYRFGTHVTEIRQLRGGERKSDSGGDDGVDVTFSDGRTETFDLVVGADGQGSRTRRLVYGQAASDAAFKPLGVSMAYFTMPRTTGDDATARFCLVPKRRFMATRSGNRPVTQGYLAVKDDAPEWRDLARQSVAQQKERWAQLFRGAGWQAERLVQGMLATEDYYAQNLGQIKMESWHKGRVVLLGDAGYCPSPMTGMGTACGIVGAYVLAGEITRHGHGRDLDAALESYEKVLQPFIVEAQKLPPPGPTNIYAETKWGVWFAYRMMEIMSTLKVDQLMNRLLPEARGGWEAPEYPELNLDH